MQGLGNDFVVIDATGGRPVPDAATIRHLADRRLGVGCDQVLIVEDPTIKGFDFRYRIFNADGSEVEQCGNGARCFARFVREHGLTGKDHIRVQTRGGPLELQIEDDGQVTVDMGPPRLEPAEIPFEAPARAPRYPLEVEGRTVEIGAVSMGNPHAVLEVPDVERAPVGELGPLIGRHPRFPQGANVGFVQIEAPDRIRLRVWERGVGETPACGTGACAAVVAGRIWGRLDRRVQVRLPGGPLVVSWDREGSPVLMTGPATTVFEGWIEL